MTARFVLAFLDMNNGHWHVEDVVLPNVLGNKTVCQIQADVDRE
jgi:hypothetical protein